MKEKKEDKRNNSARRESRQALWLSIAALVISIIRMIAKSLG